MAKYHCYYLEEGRKHSDIDIEALDDAAVLLKREELLKKVALWRWRFSSGTA
jgi:hypothetical protein